MGLHDESETWNFNCNREISNVFLKNFLLLSGTFRLSSTTNRSSVINICQKLRTKLKYWFKYTDQRCDHVNYISFFKQINYRTVHPINNFYFLIKRQSSSGWHAVPLTLLRLIPQLNLTGLVTKELCKHLHIFFS